LLLIALLTFISATPFAKDRLILMPIDGVGAEFLGYINITARAI